MKTKHLVHIMVFRVVTNDGDDMPSFKTLHLATGLCNIPQNQKNAVFLRPHNC